MPKPSYKLFTAALLLCGGTIGGALAWLLLFGGEQSSLPYCLLLGWLLGLPAAWLTADSVRQRGLRRNVRGCLITAALGAFNAAISTGTLMMLVFSGILLSILATPPVDWLRLAGWLLLPFALAGGCGAVAAGSLSLLLPKPDVKPYSFM